MKALIDKDLFDRGLNRYFARFPLQLWIISMVLTAVYLFGKAFFADGMPEDVVPASLSTAFYYGTLIAFGIFYISKFISNKAARSSWGLENLPEEGWFIPCVKGANIPNSKLGNLMLRNGEFYFQPDKQYKDTYEFKVPVDADLEIRVEPMGKRVLSYLILGAFEVLSITDRRSGKKHDFIVPETALVAEEWKKVLKG